MAKESSKAKQRKEVKLKQNMLTEEPVKKSNKRW